MNYKIYPIYLGGVDVDISTVIFRHPIGEMVRMVLGAFVLEDENGEYILVDTGAPSANEIREKGYGLRQMSDSVEYIDEIIKIGVDPKKVKLILLTHLHWDHAWNLQYFPNAQIIVHKKELAYALDPAKNQRKSYALTKEIGGPDWLHAILQFQTVKGEEIVIRPGIRLLLTPGHTPGSMSVIVDTRVGTYILCSDICINIRNKTEGLPTGSVNNVNEWYDSYEKLMLIEGTWLPNHDPEVYKHKVYG